VLLPDGRAIQRIVRNLDWLEEPEAPLYVWRIEEPAADGSIQFPWVQYAPEVERLVGELYELGFVVPFDWSGEAPQLLPLNEDEERMNTASLEEVVKLLTLHVRADRFSEGHLADALDRGLITRLLRRLKEI
jgi:uncharacterized protein DUF6508